MVYILPDGTKTLVVEGEPATIVFSTATIRNARRSDVDATLVLTGRM